MIFVRAILIARILALFHYDKLGTLQSLVIGLTGRYIGQELSKNVMFVIKKLSKNVNICT